MAQRKYRSTPPIEPQIDCQPPVRPRLAGDSDPFVASPVHGLVENLWVFADEFVDQPALESAGLYPGWVRLAIPLIASAGLWAIILWGLGLIR